MNKVKNLTVALASFAALGAASSASASLLFYDGINYAPGTYTAAESPGGWGSIGSGNSLTVTEGGLSYAGLPTSGNHLTIVGGMNSSHALPGEFNSGTLYFSYLTANQNETFRTLNVAFFQSNLEGTSLNERFAVGTRGPRGGNDGDGYLAPDGNFILLPSNPQNAEGGTVEVQQSDNPLAYGADVTLVVGKIEFNYDDNLDRITLYLNPDLSQGEPDLPYLVFGENDLGTLTHVRIFAGGSSGGLDAPIGHFDEFRFGTEYASVIPEPSTYAAIFGVLALAFAAYRRRLRR